MDFMKEVTIDKDRHLYKVDGITIPSVTNILDLYFPPCGFYTEEGRNNGHARHEWYDFLAQGKKAIEPPEDKIAQEIKGFEKFLADVKPVYKSGEKSYYHPTLRYCGTPDVVFALAGRLAVVDYKPKTKNKRTRVQTALYYLMLRANDIMVVDRYELRCYDNMYRLDRHEDTQDIKRAEVMVAAYHAAQFYK